MEVCGQFHTLTTLPPGKEPLVSVGKEAGWVPEQVLKWWRRKQSCPSWESNPGCLTIKHQSTSSTFQWGFQPMMQVKVMIKSILGGIYILQIIRKRSSNRN
jgi:hypothetical protein